MSARALVKRPKTGQQVCKSCFFEVFETEVHNTIVEGKGIFAKGEKVAIGASGGKGEFSFYAFRGSQNARAHVIDSTVLAHVLSLLNQRYEYGLDLYLLSIDEGITGYRDDSLEVSLISNLDMDGRTSN
jgi:cytoplasmic tRNA 2-thiolation protein 1